MGTGTSHTIVRNFKLSGQNLFALVIIQSLAMGIIAGPITAHFLDKATTKQCLEHDWPKEADQVHRDWCVANGYEI